VWVVKWRGLGVENNKRTHWKMQRDISAAAGKAKSSRRKWGWYGRFHLDCAPWMSPWRCRPRLPFAASLLPLSPACPFTLPPPYHPNHPLLYRPPFMVCALCLGRRVGCVIYVTRNANTWVNMQAPARTSIHIYINKPTRKKYWAYSNYFLSSSKVVLDIIIIFTFSVIALETPAIKKKLGSFLKTKYWITVHSSGS